MTREEHLEWARQRALAHLEVTGNVLGAVGIFGSDLRKHPECSDLFLVYPMARFKTKKWLEEFAFEKPGFTV